MNTTPNYNLNQWEATDKVQRTDFNADNAKIDAALKVNTDAIAQETAARTAAGSAINAALAKRGNCSVGISTYTGTGVYGSDHPTVLSFSAVPAVFFAIGSNTIGAFKGGASEGQVAANFSGVSLTSVSTSWPGSTVRIWHNGSAVHQLNRSGVTYWIVALYKMD